MMGRETRGQFGEQRPEMQGYTGQQKACAVASGREEDGATRGQISLVVFGVRSAVLQLPGSGMLGIPCPSLLCPQLSLWETPPSQRALVYPVLAAAVRVFIPSWKEEV